MEYFECVEEDIDERIDNATEEELVILMNSFSDILFLRLVERDKAKKIYDNFKSLRNKEWQSLIE